VQSFNERDRRTELVVLKSFHQPEPKLARSAWLSFRWRCGYRSLPQCMCLQRPASCGAGDFCDQESRAPGSCPFSDAEIAAMIVQTAKSVRRTQCAYACPSRNLERIPFRLRSFIPVVHHACAYAAVGHNQAGPRRHAQWVAAAAPLFKQSQHRRSLAAWPYASGGVALAWSGLGCTFPRGGPGGATKTVLQARTQQPRQ
jgi:hypothetical protein